MTRGSRRADEARPVRTLLISERRWSMALCILSRVSSITRAARSSSSISGPAYRSSRPSADQRTDGLAAERTRDVARNHQVEHPNGQVVVLAEGDGGEIHHPQVPVDHLHEGDLVVAGGLGMEFGIGRVDAVDARVGALAQELGADLRRPQ